MRQGTHKARSMTVITRLACRGPISNCGYDAPLRIDFPESGVKALALPLDVAKWSGIIARAFRY